MTASRPKQTLWWFLGGVLAVVCIGFGLGSVQALAAAPGYSVVAGGAGGAGMPSAYRPVADAPKGVLVSSGASMQSGPSVPNSCPGNYQIVQVAAGAPVSGTNLVLGSQCDDCEVPITLPFQYNFYGRSFLTPTVAINGQIAFDSPSDHSYTNYCLPDANTNYAILPYWRDVSMDIGLQQCIDIGCGIYTSTTGTAPSRIFNIEYRAISLFTYTPIYYEVRLYESQVRFDIIYYTIDSDAPNATIGAQKGTGGLIASYQCPGHPGGLTSGTMLVFGYSDSCPTATPTPTSTPSSSSRLVGHVSYMGRPAQPDPASILPVTLTLRLQNGGPQIDYAGLTTDASGFFTVPVGSLPNGNYFWRVKTVQSGNGQTDFNPGFLSNSGPVTLNGPGVYNVEMGTLASGDVDNNDRVNAVDFITVKLSFGQQPGQPQWDRRADFDGNNRVTAVDFIQLKVNFGHVGSPPIGP
ncbi:MAG: dockerin type I repeat-containing protein [Chloroflexia bacterium]